MWRLFLIYQNDNELGINMYWLFAGYCLIEVLAVIPDIILTSLCQEIQFLKCWR